VCVCVCVCVCVSLYVWTITFELDNDLWPRQFACWFSFTLYLSAISHDLLQSA